MPSSKAVISLRLDADIDAVVRAEALKARLPVSAYVQWVLSRALQILPPDVEAGSASVAAPSSIAAPKRSKTVEKSGGGAQIPKVGVNEPCPCGSGKKYKRCHGAP